MDPVTAILGAASLAGAIFGNQRKQIDINWLKQKFGPAAVSEEAIQLFNTIINSPYGRSIMTNAAEQGQQLQHSINSQAAQAGFGGGGGANSGASIFATSAAEGATNALQRDASGQLFQQALPIAQQLVSDRMQAYLGDYQSGGQPTAGARLWQKVGDAAGVVGSMYKPGQKNTAGTVHQSSADLGQLAAPMPSAQKNLYQAPQVPQFSILRRFGRTGMVRPLQQQGALQ